MADQDSNFVTVKCASYQDMLVNRLYDYFLANRGVDFAIQWGERTVRAHRVILDLFLSPDELAETVADEHGCSPEPFFEFLYNGTLTVPENQLERLLAVAKKSNFIMLAEGLSQGLWSSGGTSKTGSDPSGHQLIISRGNQGEKKEESNNDEPVVAEPEELTTDIDLSMEVDGDDNSSTTDETKEDGGSSSVEASKSTRKSAGTNKSTAQQSTSKSASKSTTSPAKNVKPKRRYTRSWSDNIDYHKEVPPGNCNAASKTGPSPNKPSMIVCPKCNYRTPFQKRMDEHLYKHNTPISKRPAKPPPSVQVPKLKVIEEAEPTADTKPAPQTQPAAQTPSITTTTSTQDPAEATRRITRIIRQCPHCPYTSGNLDQYQVHQAKHDPTIQIHKCQFCSKKMTDPAKLALHSCMRLGGANLYTCPHCDFRHLNYVIFRNHVTRHDPNTLIPPPRAKTRPVFMTRTPRRPRTKKPPVNPQPSTQLDLAITIEPTVVPAPETQPPGTLPVKRVRQCPHCPFSSASLDQFLVHQAVHDPTIKIYKCQYCDKRMVDPEKLARHSCMQQAGANLHLCPHCDFKHCKLAVYRLHVARHDPNAVIQQCNECKKEFADEELLSRHRCRHKPVVKQMHQCPFCPAKKSNVTYLRYHIEGFHSATKPYKCEEPGCNYVASMKCQVTDHYKFAHLNLRPFVCETCGHRAFNRWRLKHHQRVHSDERPYKCSECDRTFRDSKSRKQHQSKHFGAPRTHVCHLCGRAFYQKSTMRTHLKCVHKSDIPQLTTSS